MNAKEEILKKSVEYNGLCIIPLFLKEMANLLGNFICENIYLHIQSGRIVYFMYVSKYNIMEITQSFDEIIIEMYDEGNIVSRKTISNDYLNKVIKLLK